MIVIMEIRKLNEIMKEIQDRIDYLLDLESTYRYDENKMNEIVARYAENKRILMELKEIFKYENKR